MSAARLAIAQQVARLAAKGGDFGAVRDTIVGALKAPGTGEPWAEDDPALPRIEARAIRAMLADWHALRGRVFDLLGLDRRAKAVGEVFTFSPELLAELLLLGEVYARTAGSPDGPLVQAAWAAFLRGIANAASDRDVEALIEEALGLQRASIEARGLELVRSATGRAYRRRIVAELLSGQYDGMNPLVVARKLRKRFDAGDYDWERLARSETAMAQSDGKLAQYEAAGVTVVDYVTAGDSRVSRICRGLADAGPYALALAPIPVRNSHPNCFPAGTLVHAAGLIASSDRGHAGEFVEVATAAGHLLTVTANHPILTPHGWVAAGLLDVGSHVIDCRRPERMVAAVNPHDHHGPALIEEVAVTLGTAARVAAVTVPTTAEDFHGDGFDSNIDVVGATGALHGHTVEAAIAQSVGELNLGFAAIRLQQLPGDGALAQLARGHHTPAHSSVRETGEAASLGGGGVPHAQEHGFTASAYGNAALAESAREQWAVVAAAIGEGFETLAPFVTVDEIIKVRHFLAAHRVYNLETSTGWYVAEGIVVHNCRCTLLARE